MDARLESHSRPDIFSYHDYREFLKAWLEYLRSGPLGVSMRTVSSKAGIAAGYLPMVVAGERKLSDSSFEKLKPHLHLSVTEASYFTTLIALTEASSQVERLGALKKMQRFQAYRDVNPRELEVYQYLTKWYYVAIREMSNLPDFRLEAHWIQDQLLAKVSIPEIEDALEFLVNNGFITAHANGAIKPQDKLLQCMSGVYRLSLAEFHKQVFSLAIDSIETVPREQRNILGHTVAVSEAQYLEVRKLLDETLKRIQEIKETAEPKDRLYHIGLFAFPLSIGKGNTDETPK